MVPKTSHSPVSIIKTFNPLEFKSLEGRGIGESFLIYSILAFATDDEIVNIFDAPGEWLKEFYPEALKYGPYFREVDLILNFAANLDPSCPEITKLIKEYKASLLLGNFKAREKGISVLTMFGRKPNSVTEEPLFKVIENKLGSDFIKALFNFLIGVMVKDLQNYTDAFNYMNFVESDYLNLISDWQAAFGSQPQFKLFFQPDEVA